MRAYPLTVVKILYCLSLVLQDAFAPGGLAPLETQPARAARDSQ